MKKNDIEKELDNKIENYYEKMYSSVGLKNIHARIELRKNEDTWELIKIENLERTLQIRMTDYKRHLIVGVGTAGLAIALKNKGVKEICGIDPNQEAVSIAIIKGSMNGLDKTAFEVGVVEKLSYLDESFDFIHCYTVLEHVQNVEMALCEMYRVLSTGGRIYIHTPNYTYPWEGHYKLPAPTFLGKQITKAWLRLFGRPTRFVDSLQFISVRYIDRILKKYRFEYYRLRHRDKHFEMKNLVGSPAHILWVLIDFFLEQKLGINRHQEIIIKKGCH